MSKQYIDKNKVIIALSHNKCGNDENDIAVQTCIETIKKLPTVELISREEVLNLLDTAFECGAFDGRYAYENLVDAVQNLIHPLETKALEQQTCEDAISREEALKYSHIEYDDGEEHSVIYTEDIEELPSVTPQPKNGRWIPVSERLPQERDWYLAVFKEIDTGFQLIPIVADYIGNVENEWRIMNEDSLGQEYRSILECIAWMPLPTPYKAESEEI